MELHRTPHARPGRGVDAVGEGMGQGGLETVDWQRLMPPKGFVVLPSRWVVQRTFFMDRPEQEDELRDYEKLCVSGEALVYAAMIRLMRRRLARF
jgi:transposase